MTCKDCYHCNACCGHDEEKANREYPPAEKCRDFKGKSRIVEVPVKPGDKVYKITRNKVKECEVVFVGISADERCSHFNFVENYEDGSFYRSYSMVFDLLGKSVFLAKEEAIKKLGEKKV